MYFKTKRYRSREVITLRLITCLTWKDVCLKEVLAPVSGLEKGVCKGVYIHHRSRSVTLSRGMFSLKEVCFLRDFLLKNT